MYIVLVSFEAIEELEEEKLDKIIAFLPGFRKEKYLSIKHEEEKKRSLAASIAYVIAAGLFLSQSGEDEKKVFLKICKANDLMKYMNKLYALDFKLLDKINKVSYLEHNKPQNPYFSYNLSHSGPYAVCGLAALDYELGLDIEVARKMPDKLLSRIMTEEEIRLCSCDEGLKLRFWTMKEAYLKAKGTGIRGANAEDFPPIKLIEDEYEVIKEEICGNPISFLYKKA
jgi:hypothetical protein